MKKGLGRGLGALIPETGDDAPEGVIEIKVTDIEPNPDQPRKHFDKDKLNALADSISQHGVIQPLVLKKTHNGYRIIAGERRWRAAYIAGVKTVPAVIKDYDERELAEITLIENLQREDLNPIEEATGFRSLMDEYKMTQEEISKRVGRSRPAVANALRLLTLCVSVKQMVIDGAISGGHARALVTVENVSLQEELAKKIVENGLSVRQIEGLVANLDKGKASNGKKSSLSVNPELKRVEKMLSGTLGTKVKIVQGRSKGKIEIEYYDNDSFTKIVKILNK